MRDVAKRWLALASASRESTDLEELCSAAGIQDTDLVGDVLGTAFALGIGLSDVIGGIVAMPAAVDDFYAAAPRSPAGR